MIKNVILDLDNTIFDFTKAEHLALSKTLQQLGIEPKTATLNRYSELNQAQWQLLELGKITREQVKLRRFRFLFDELGVQASEVEAAHIYEHLLGQGHFFMEGAEELLSTLNGKYRLYLASNGTTSVQKGRLASAGIEDIFEEIFLSEAIGAEKPSRQFFDYCFARIPDFRREETVIVGDSLTSDIKGGINAGICTIWFHPQGGPNRSEIQPDYEIRRLTELPPLLAQIL